MRLRREEKDGDALAVESEARCVRVERDEVVERDARWLSLLHSSAFAHAAETEGAPLVHLTFEPLDRKVAELFDLVVAAASFGNVGERYTNFGKLRRGCRVSRCHEKVGLRGVVRVHPIGIL